MNMKVAIPVIQNPHKEGEYPVYYNGVQAGVAKVTHGGQNVLLDLNLKSNNPDDQAVLDKLADKINNKKASVTSVGSVQYDVINSQDMLEATLSGFVVNDLPDYIPYEKEQSSE